MTKERLTRIRGLRGDCPCGGGFPGHDQEASRLLEGVDLSNGGVCINNKDMTDRQVSQSRVEWKTRKFGC